MRLMRIMQNSETRKRLNRLVKRTNTGDSDSVTEEASNNVEDSSADDNLSADDGDDPTQHSDNLSSDKIDSLSAEDSKDADSDDEGIRDKAEAAIQATTSGIKTAAEVVAGGVGAAARATKSGSVAAAEAVADSVVAASKATKSGSVAAAGVIQGVIVGTGTQINQIVQSMVSGPTSLYDKALDATYLDPLLRSDMGGSYHRLFDGGHTITGAVKAVNAASIDDTFTRQTVGTMEALLRDASTTRGLPLATWDKATFDSVAQNLESSLGIPKRWLYDINTFDAGEALGASIGVVAVALNWNSADTEQFAQMTAGMGLSAAVGLNPLLLIVTVAAAAQSFNKARLSGDYSDLADGAFKGAATSAASLGAIAAITAAGGPAGAGLLVGLATGLLVHQTVKNISITEVTGYVTARVEALAPTVATWAQELLNRNDAEPVDRLVAKEILALPSVTAAAEVAAPVVDNLNETLTNQPGTNPPS